MKIELPPLHPKAFFEIQARGRYFKKSQKAKKLFSSFLIDHPFEENKIRFFLGWNEQALLLKFEIPFACQKCFSAHFRRGDSVEFLICTRPVQTSYLGKYHHHFVFFPEQVEGFLAKEVTCFRFGDMHELANPKDIFVEAAVKPKNYTLEIFLPSSVLFGYDPLNFSELFFTYIVNRYHERSFCYSASLDEYKVEKHPFLWSRLFLEN